MAKPSDDQIFEAPTGGGGTAAAQGALLLSRADIARLMSPADYLPAVEAGFRAARAGKVDSPPPLHIAVPGGGFHAKGAALMGDRRVVALKLNGNFPGNPGRGLPTIQGVILLCDAENGVVLAVLDSIEVTLRRTAAATALAARHLAHPASTTLAVIGCGAQARPQIDALMQVFTFERCFVFDSDRARAAAFARDTSRALDLHCEAVGSVREAALLARIIVTCTTSRSAFLDVDDVAPGSFVAAVGADNPDKSEIAPRLMARAKVVTDVLDQCLVMGDLRHAIAAGAMTRDQVHAELGDIIAGARPGRTGEEVAIFDSTGTAIQDVASAAAAYRRALEAGRGGRFSFS